MSDKNIVLLSWDDSSKAYEAFSKFRTLDFGGVQVSGSAVLERDANGALKVTDDQDNALGLGTLGGGSIGALIGILGGPLGVLLGYASGALVGSAFDVSRSVDSDGVVSELSQALPPGRTGLIAEVEEVSPKAIDDYAQENGASLIRRSEDEVLDEIAAAEDAADAAAQAAQEKVREAKKAERKEKRDERIAKLKDRFHITSADGK